MKEFTKGIVLKDDTLSDPSFIRMQNFKFGKRIGTLESRGGWADWDLGVDFTTMNGLKRWYREDGGVNFFLVGTQAGGVRRIWYVGLESPKSITTLFAIDTDIIDDDVPVTWVDCGSQLLCIPEMSSGRPYSIKLKGYDIEGGIGAKKLGLDPPVPNIVANAFGSAAAGTNQMPRSMIEAGDYKYAYTYSFGTYSEPEKYGESGFSFISNIRYLASTAGYVGGADHNGIIQITGWPTTAPDVFIRRINIYRSQKGLVTLYKIGEIYYTPTATSSWNDSIGDSLIDTSKTGPTLTGVPTTMRCALWHPGIQRLFWFGIDGFFHWSAAGLPDVNPTENKIAVGDTGYNGNGIFLIRDNVYAFKDDGIFLVSGDSPNYFSKKITSTSCSAKASFAEMDDGVYFLGVSEKKIQVYRFNGNSASPISPAIDALLPANKDSVLKRAFGKAVGDEYWLSLMISDIRYCKWPLPYNNVILAYDTRNSQWTSFPAQACSIELFDGPGDSGELFLLESDPTNSSSKGNLFRFEENLGIANLTTYASTTRSYNKATLNPAIISYGPIPGMGKEGGLERLTVHGFKLRHTYVMSASPIGHLYEDTKVFQKALTAALAPEALEKYGETIQTGDAASKYGTGKYGTAKYEENYQEELLYNIGDEIRTGVIIDLNYLYSNSTKIEIQALEVMLETTEKE